MNSELQVPLQFISIKVTGECSIGNYEEKLDESSSCYAGFFCGGNEEDHVNPQGSLCPSRDVN
jgi:hypothetical protein